MNFRALLRLTGCAATMALVVATYGCAHGGVGASGAAPQPQDATRGDLFIVGGGPIPKQITQRFVELSGGTRARIAVLPMASAVATTGPDKVAELRSLGANAFVLNVTRANADADSIIRSLETATGIWFPGGNQNRITAALSGSRAERVIRERYFAGATVGGTSAGAAVLSQLMITGDERKPGGSRPPADSSQAYLTIDRDNIVTVPGLMLVQGAVIDQHFVRRRRHNRLISLVLENPSIIAAGVDESTAIHVRPDGSWLVMGESVVVIFDARRSRVTRRESSLGASGVVMHVLPAGSVYDPNPGSVLSLGGQPF